MHVYHNQYLEDDKQLSTTRSGGTSNIFMPVYSKLMG